MTTAHDPAGLRDRTRELMTLLLAVGLDRSTLFRQSAVPAHTGLAYLLECTAHTGELNRMIQFKEKGRDVPTTRASLFTYPVLMAADILLYRPAEVPVGDDQRQHVELTRDLAIRFNNTYGPVFTVPEIVTPAGRGAGDGPGRADPQDEQVGRRARQHPAARPARRRTPQGGARGHRLRHRPAAVRADRDAKPGVTNLLDILTACGGSADGITTYGALKAAVTDAVVAVLTPLQERYRELADDPSYVDGVFDAGRGAVPRGHRAGAVRRPVGDGAVSSGGPDPRVVRQPVRRLVAGLGVQPAEHDQPAVGPDRGLVDVHVGDRTACRAWSRSGRCRRRRSPTRRAAVPPSALGDQPPDPARRCRGRSAGVTTHPSRDRAPRRAADRRPGRSRSGGRPRPGARRSSASAATPARSRGAGSTARRPTPAPARRSARPARTPGWCRTRTRRLPRPWPPRCSG